MHGHVIVKRKCPSTNFVLTIFFFCNYLTYLCRIKLIEYVQNLPLTCLDICRMLSITSTGNVILCLNEGLSFFIRSVLYVVA